MTYSPGSDDDDVPMQMPRRRAPPRVKVPRSKFLNGRIQSDLINLIGILAMALATANLATTGTGWHIFSWVLSGLTVFFVIAGVILLLLIPRSPLLRDGLGKWRVDNYKWLVAGYFVTFVWVLIYIGFRSISIAVVEAVFSALPGTAEINDKELVIALSAVTLFALLLVMGQVIWHIRTSFKDFDRSETLETVENVVGGLGLLGILAALCWSFIGSFALSSEVRTDGAADVATIIGSVAWGLVEVTALVFFFVKIKRERKKPITEQNVPGWATIIGTVARFLLLAVALIMWLVAAAAGYGHTSGNTNNEAAYQFVLAISLGLFLLALLIGAVLGLNNLRSKAIENREKERLRAEQDAFHSADDPSEAEENTEDLNNPDVIPLSVLARNKERAQREQRARAASMPSPSAPKKKRVKKRVRVKKRKQRTRSSTN